MAEQKDKCPECINGQVMTGHRVWHPCPTCKGTGEKKLDKSDREGNDGSDD